MLTRTLAAVALGALVAIAQGCTVRVTRGDSATAMPAAASRTGEVRVASFDAPSLGARKHYVVYLPPSYAANAQALGETIRRDAASGALVRELEDLRVTCAI